MIMAKLTGGERYTLRFSSHQYLFMENVSLMRLQMPRVHSVLQEQNEENTGGWETVGTKPHKKHQKVVSLWMADNSI